MIVKTERFFNRDLSWLRFNHRVLQEAADPQNPLYERIKFLAIFSSNLDEFFKVRVSAIRQLKTIDKKIRKRLVSKPNKLIREIQKEVSEQQEWFGSIFREQLLPELAENNILLPDYTQFDAVQQKFVSEYFDTHFKDITVAYCDAIRLDAPVFLEDEAMALVINFSEGDKTPALIKFPEGAARFIQIPSKKDKHCIVFLDDVLKSNLGKIFGDQKIAGCYAVKITRDADLYIEDEFSGAFVDKIYGALPKRKTGQATRVLIDKKMPLSLRKKIKETFFVDEVDMVKGGVYHNFRDFFSLPNPLAPLLQYVPLKQKLLKPEADESVFDVINRKDILLHFPYDDFQILVQWILEIARDPQVTRLCISLYRIGKNSTLMQAISEVCKQGKEVFIFIEAQARFDEQHNIEWGRHFEELGAQVAYSIPGIKVHSKILLVQRKEADGTLKNYSFVSTGNFSEKNATVYGDLGILTANPKITADVEMVFKVLTREIILPRTKKALVAPFTLRSGFVKLVKGEIQKIEKGKDGYILLKMNSLEDPEMIELLYDASNKGVKIDLIIRGICCLVPGIPGQSKNIKIRSIVGRYLEHSRVYIFGKDQDEKMYIGSADWMVRNLDHRIEVVIPVLDEHIKARIRHFVNLQMKDNVKARLIDARQQNGYITNNKKALNSQEEL